MLLGESDYEDINRFERWSNSHATILLGIMWVMLTLVLMILFLNIIIAQMNEVQAERTA